MLYVIVEVVDPVATVDDRGRPTLVEAAWQTSRNKKIKASSSQKNL